MFKRSISKRRQRQLHRQVIGGFAVTDEEGNELGRPLLPGDAILLAAGHVAPNTWGKVKSCYHVKGNHAEHLNKLMLDLRKTGKLYAENGDRKAWITRSDML